MGNREDLLEGAKRCLQEKGYARTTARDIASAAGTSLAAIGYHFKTTEALLNAALVEAIGDWGAEIERALKVELAPDATPIQRFEAVWPRVLDTFEDNRRLWVTQFEFLLRAQEVPEVRQHLTVALEKARYGLGIVFGGIDVEAEPRRAWQVGAFYDAVLNGLLVQWLIDPATSPSAGDLTDALYEIATGERRPAPAEG
ncbi:TetR/AcrR family transcriptional regulator [Flindersiella endophytica]